MPESKEAWARALGAEVQAAGRDRRLELVDLHHLSDDLPHAVVRALLSWLEDIHPSPVAGVEVAGFMPFCVVCGTAVPNPFTAVLLSASTPEPASIVNAICDSCATLPVPELEEECAAYFAEWIPGFFRKKEG